MSESQDSNSSNQITKDIESKIDIVTDQSRLKNEEKIFELRDQRINSIIKN